MLITMRTAQRHYVLLSMTFISLLAIAATTTPAKTTAKIEMQGKYQNRMDMLRSIIIESLRQVPDMKNQPPIIISERKLISNNQETQELHVSSIKTKKLSNMKTVEQNTLNDRHLSLPSKSVTNSNAETTSPSHHSTPTSKSDSTFITTRLSTPLEHTSEMIDTTVNKQNTIQSKDIQHKSASTQIHRVMNTKKEYQEAFNNKNITRSRRLKYLLSRANCRAFRQQISSYRLGRLPAFLFLSSHRCFHHIQGETVSQRRVGFRKIAPYKAKFHAYGK